MFSGDVIIEFWFYNEAGRFSTGLKYFRFGPEFFSLISEYDETGHYMTKRR